LVAADSYALGGACDSTGNTAVVWTITSGSAADISADGSTKQNKIDFVAIFRKSANEY